MIFCEFLISEFWLITKQLLSLRQFMIPHKTPYQNASVFPLFSRKTSENMGFREKMRDFVFPLFSQNKEKSKVETSRLLTKNGKEIRHNVQERTIRKLHLCAHP